MALAQRLADMTIHAVYSSDLPGARKTAEIIARPHALPVHLDSRFREMNFGVWEGLVHDEIRWRHRVALAAWQEDLANQVVLLMAHGGSLWVCCNPIQGGAILTALNDTHHYNGGRR